MLTDETAQQKGWGYSSSNKAGTAAGNLYSIAVAVDSYSSLNKAGTNKAGSGTGCRVTVVSTLLLFLLFFFFCSSYSVLLVFLFYFTYV